tara:strand:+ start:747 stop:1028 length:282 start_codon:yes stop_codon:yes gene_type:complete
MDEFKNVVQKYSNDDIRMMENLMEAAEKLLDNIRYSERKINLKLESQDMWIEGFGERNPRYDHEIEISEMAKNRLKRSFESLLMEMYQSTKKM